jgi:hypothetical protein
MNVGENFSNHCGIVFVPILGCARINIISKSPMSRRALLYVVLALVLVLSFVKFADGDKGSIQKVKGQGLFRRVHPTFSPGHTTTTSSSNSSSHNITSSATTGDGDDDDDDSTTTTSNHYIVAAVMILLSIVLFLGILLGCSAAHDLYKHSWLKNKLNAPFRAPSEDTSLIQHHSP